MKKKNKEKEQAWRDRMARDGPEVNRGTYRDKYRSGVKRIVEAKQREKLKSKNEEIRTYRNFYKNNKFHYMKGTGMAKK